jgi:hypothetical protein
MEGKKPVRNSSKPYISVTYAPVVLQPISVTSPHLWESQAQSDSLHKTLQHGVSEKDAPKGYHPWRLRVSAPFCNCLTRTLMFARMFPCSSTKHRILEHLRKSLLLLASPVSTVVWWIQSESMDRHRRDLSIEHAAGAKNYSLIIFKQSLFM